MRNIRFVGFRRVALEILGPFTLFLVKSRRVAPGNFGAYVRPLSSFPTWRGLQRGAARALAGGGDSRAAKAKATAKWRQLGSSWGCGACTRRSWLDGWGSIYIHALVSRTTCTDRRWGSVFWRSCARVIRGRLPVIGHPKADLLHHGPPPPRTYAHGREAVDGAGQARRGRRCTRGSRPVSGERRAGGYRLSRPCSG